MNILQQFLFQYHQLNFSTIDSADKFTQTKNNILIIDHFIDQQIGLWLFDQNIEYVISLSRRFLPALVPIAFSQPICIQEQSLHRQGEQQHNFTRRRIVNPVDTVEIMKK